jgi:phytanoyl-CoA hydroxylase
MSAATATQAVMSKAQIEQYDREGFVIARSLFSADEAGAIREVFMHQAALGHVPNLFEPRAGTSDSDPLARYPRMMHPHRHPAQPVGPVSLRTMLDPRLRAALAALLREEAIAAQSMFYFKPPGARGQALHQDNFYLKVNPGRCIAAWVAIDAADRGNGGLEVVPGTQTSPIACPEAADPKISFTNHYVPAPKGLAAIPVNLAPGDVLFFGGALLHGSQPNTSADRFRRAFICHYLPASATAISSYYRPLLDFDGNVVERADAPDGGPCGEPISGPH